MIKKPILIWIILPIVIGTIIGLVSIQYTDYSDDYGGTILEIPQVDVNREIIRFAYTDDLTDEDLIIRTDKETYGGWGSADVYVYVENIGKSQNYDVYWLFSEENELVESVALLEKDVPYLITVEDYEMVNYDCGYLIEASATSSEEWVDKTCQKREQTGTHDETRYRDEWQELTLDDFTHQSRGKNAKKKFTAHIPKDAVYYLKVGLKFPLKANGEFYAEAVGDKGGYGFIDPWYNSSWTYRQAITIDNTKITDDLTNFPVAVIFASSTFDYTHAQEDGDDMIFTSSDGQTLIDFEREIHSTTTDSYVYHVEVPSISSSTDTTIYMYYGNAGASDAATTTGVWDSNFVAVHHMVDAITPNATSTLDSTRYGNVGTKDAIDNPIETTGKMHKAQDFDQVDDRITIGSDTELDNISTITIEMWIELGMTYILLKVTSKP